MAFERWEGRHQPVHAERATVKLALPADFNAPASARHAIHGLTNGYDREFIADAELLVTELVANAVRYGVGDDVHVAVWAKEGKLDVVVLDGGSGFTPEDQPHNGERLGGHGLQIVDTLSERWGTSPGCVWFQVAMPDSPEAPPALPQPDAGLLNIRRLMDSVTHHALAALDVEGRVASWSPGAERLLGYAADDTLGCPLSDLYAPASERALERQLADAIEGDGEDERWMRRKDGTVLWAKIATAPIHDGGGNVSAFSAVISDHTTQRQLDEERDILIAELRDMSVTDELTQLPNRRGWAKELARELSRAKRSKQPLAVVMLDLNGFKQFNDWNGHVQGDELLRGLARAWSEPLRATDMLARYGGDEFAMTLPDCPAAAAFGVISRMQAMTPEGVGSAAGIVTTDGCESAEAVVRRADNAMYAAKRRGTNAVLGTLE